MSNLRLTYYPDITQHRSPNVIRDAIVGFAAALSDDLSARTGAAHSIDVLPVVSTREQTDMIADGRSEIALIRPSAYVYAHRRNARVLPAAVALRLIDGQIGDTYFAQIYTHVATGITSLEDLQRRCHEPLDRRPSVGFGDPFSTANFLVPAAELAAHGLLPWTRFARMEFLGGHDGVARGVYARRVDVGAGHDGAIVDLARQPGYEDAEQQLRRLARRDIHSDPVAVCVDDALRPQITESLVAISTRPDVKEHLEVFWGAVKGLGRTRHENYASIEQAIGSLALSEADVLGL
jgi:ABC-type phosphate/phosphonate transport system substrate-binding protein